jgi:hypothetical protein
MICENCHREREKGGEFRFYYGKKESNRIFGSRPEIHGEMNLWICHSCISRFRGLVALVTILVAATSVIWMIHLARLGDVIFRMVIFGTLAAVIVVIAAWIIFGTRQEVGERLAIHARKGEVHKQGYNAFLTTMARSRLP